MDWLKFGCEEWDKFSSFKKFAQFVSKLLVVNDGGERGLKGIQVVVSLLGRTCWSVKLRRVSCNLTGGKGALKQSLQSFNK